MVVAQAAVLSRIVVLVFQGNSSPNAIMPSLGVLAGIVAIRSAIPAGSGVLTTWASGRIRADLRRRVLQTVLRNGPVWAAEQTDGKLTAAAGPGLESLDGYVVRVLPALAGAVVIPPFVLLSIGLVDWQSAGVLVVTLPLVPIFMILVGKTTRQKIERQYAALSRLSGHFLDLLQGLATLKVYGRAQAQIETVRRSTENYRKHTMATLRVAFLSGLVMDLIATLSVAVVAVNVGLRLDHGGMDLWSALFVLLLAPELFAPLRSLGAQHHANEEGQVAATAALDVLTEQASSPEREWPAEVGASQRVPVSPLKFNGNIELRSLTLRYREREDAALEDVDLRINAGEILAIEGPSGGGKTTLLASLLGFVPDAPAPGHIFVGDACGLRALSSVALAEWRTNIAWVPQRPRPTSSTVRDEVAMGAPHASEEQIAAVARACATPPLTTPLGEGGARVSAGERRRIALARALLRARQISAAGAIPLVLLDEPSEDLDAATEQIVSGVVAEMAGWATVIAVTHSSVISAVADRVVTLAGGRIRGDVVRAAGAFTRPAALLQAETAQVAAARRSTSPVAAVPGVGATIPITTRQLLRRTWAIFDGKSAAVRPIVVSAALSAAAGVAGLALTATSIWLICRAAQRPNVQALEVAVVGVRFFALSRALLRYGERLSSHDGALRLLAHLRTRVFAALVPLVPAGLADLRRGDLLRRFVGDVDGVQDGVVRAAIPAFGAVVTASTAVVVAASLVPSAGLVLLCGLLVAVAVSVPVVHRSTVAAELASVTGRRDGCATALLEGVAELVAYGRGDHAVDELSGLDVRAERLAGGRARGLASADALVGVVSAMTFAATFIATVVTVSAKDVAPIAVGVVLACLLVAFEQIATLPSAYMYWRSCMAGIARVLDVVERPSLLKEPRQPHDSPTAPFGLHIDAASVAPAALLAPVLRNVVLDIEQGSRVALVGPSGCGKSTLLAAVLRQLPLQKGRIELRTAVGESVLLANLCAEQIPALIAGSMQNDHVFNATLRDNLRLVRPEATDDDLAAVARRAGLVEFVDSLPDGWSTLAGPDGAQLSGGQRQRLLLARALLAAPQILVLDEPTAHLDPETERRVIADILDATHGQTVLLSTHRRRDEMFDSVVEIRDGSCLTRRRVTPATESILVS